MERGYGENVATAEIVPIYAKEFLNMLMLPT